MLTLTPDDPTQTQRKALRTTLRQRRRELPAEQHHLWSQRIAEACLALPAFCEASSIALYLSDDGEPDPSLIATTAWAQNKRVYLPLLNNNTLKFAPFTTATSFADNRFDIPEPMADDTALVEANDIDIIFMPLVGFDEHCQRLGRGGGHYDRALEHASHPLLIGLAYECQKLQTVPVCGWDVPLDGIVTENTVYLRK